MRPILTLYIKNKAKKRPPNGAISLTSLLIDTNFFNGFITTCLFCCCCLFSLPAIAQDAEELEAERTTLLKNIEQTAKLLTTTRKSQAAVIDEFYTIQRQIDQRGQLINTLQKEIQTAAFTMEYSALVVDSLELEMGKLKEEYAAMIQQAFRSKMGNNDMLFLLSAKSFNQALRRWRYIRQYDEYRKKQLYLIIDKQTALKGRIRQLELNQYKQEELLLFEKSQKVAVESELSYKGTLLARLKEDEQQISLLLRQQKQAHERLNNAVAALIEADISLKDETAQNRVAEATNETPNKELSADLSYQFATHRGKMEWPIGKGVITRYYGSQVHPIHKKILINNNGIDIRARADKTVFSLYEGLVTAIQMVPGYRYTLILQHGEYYSVYSNLETVNVKKGDIIMAQQAIGKVGIGHQKEYPELHLEIWKGKKRLNPFGWLRKL